MKNATRARLIAALGIAALAGVVAVVAFATSGSRAHASSLSYPRNETLYTSGSQWGDIQGFNPFVVGSATGTVGLAYETLFRFDPVKNDYIPWLAESGNWSGQQTYTLTIRSGVEWSDGKPFTAGDVAWNLQLGRLANATWHDLFQQLAPNGVSASGNNVSLAFRETPRYAEWTTLLWNLPMVSPSQWSSVSNDTLLTFKAFPVGTGPYVADEAGYNPSTQVVWTKNPNGWWASTAGVSPEPKPTYIIDLVNTSDTNNLEKGLMSGLEDLNNNYLPGIQQYVKNGDLETYFPGRPFMLAANTVWLEPNTTHQPLDDPAFRRALATSIDVGRIVYQDYGDLVQPASPTGLLPTWSRFIDQESVAKYGFTYSTSNAAWMLTKAGYPRDSEGMFANKDGSRLELTISVPQYWGDWETARDIIVDSARAAGIRLTAQVKDYNSWQADRSSGNFDLIIDNPYQLTDNPWAYWNGIYHLPLNSSGSQTNSNFERYIDQQAWKLVQQLDGTPPSNTADIQELNARLQTLLMKDMPVIPLWYSGIWSQFGSQHWTNWPSAQGARNYVPSMWNGYLQMTGIDTITHLQLVVP